MNTRTILIKLLIKTFKISILLKNPNKGGIPPNDIKIIKIENLSKNIIEFIWLNILKL